MTQARFPSRIQRQPLDGKVVLVSGAVGMACAALTLSLVREGATVAVVAPTAQALRETRDRVSEGTDPILAVVSDMANAGQISTVLATVSETFGPLDVLVNFADPSPFNGPYLDLYAQDVAEELERCVVRVAEISYQVARGMAARRSGSVINITSAQTVRPWPGLAGRALELALLELTDSLAEKWSHEHIRFNAICAGRMSEVLARSRYQGTLEIRLPQHPPDLRRSILEDLCDAVLWLASDTSSHLSGLKFTPGPASWPMGPSNCFGSGELSSANPHFDRHQGLLVRH